MSRAVVTLGGYPFPKNPMRISPIIDKRKISAAVDTWDSVATYDFGTRIEGLEVTFEWDYLEEAQYAQLQTLLETEGNLELNMTGSSNDGLLYTVHLLSLTGAYFMYIAAGTGRVRRDVALRFVVVSEP